MSTATGRSRALLIGVLVLCAAVVLGLLALESGSGSTEPATTGQTTTERTTTEQTTTEPTTEARSAEPEAAHTPSSGLPTIAESDLPPEAWDTMQLIDDGGPFPYRQDDSTFFNREGILPDQRRGYYREYTVETPGWHDRGARRIVAGAEGDLYWTEDHYDSFRQIMEGQ